MRKILMQIPAERLAQSANGPGKSLLELGWWCVWLDSNERRPFQQILCMERGSWEKRHDYLLRLLRSHALLVLAQCSHGAYPQATLVALQQSRAETQAATKITKRKDVCEFF